MPMQFTVDIPVTFTVTISGARSETQAFRMAREFASRISPTASDLSEYSIAYAAGNHGAAISASSLSLNEFEPVIVDWKGEDWTE